MKNIYKVILFLSLFSLVAAVSARESDADWTIDNGIKFIKSKQISSGAISGGFSSPSQWSAIGLTTNGLDISSLKTATDSASLKDFLLSDVPKSDASSTDWESRILSIVAIGEDPTNFGGVNYVKKLEGFYSHGQMGDACALNDDIFGLLALIASGNAADGNIKQTELDFIIKNQDPTDGGFSWSASSCPYYSTAADMTAAGVQALQAAKNNNLTSSGLDSALLKAKNYLLANRDSDGGFGYYGSSDADTTGWVLMALNAVSPKDDPVTVKTRNWLVSQQQTDGGFLSYPGEDSTTTAQALIALAGTGWILKIFNLAPLPATPPSATVSAVIASGPASPPSPTTISAADILNLLTAGYFSIPQAATASATPVINVNQQITINTPAGPGTSSVTLPSGITIRRSDGANLNISTLSAASVSVGTLSGYGANVIVDGNLQWGIPGIGLDFTSPITLNIYVGPNFNGQTLNVQRSTSGSGGWTNDGITDPKTCIVTAGLCSFQATKASYYAAAHPTSTNNSNSTNITSTATATTTPAATTVSPPNSPVTSASPTKINSKTAAKLEAKNTQTDTPQPEVLGQATASPTLALTREKDFRKPLIFFFLSISCFLAVLLYWRGKSRKY